MFIDSLFLYKFFVYFACRYYHVNITGYRSSDEYDILAKAWIIVLTNIDYSWRLNCLCSGSRLLKLSLSYYCWFGMWIRICSSPLKVLDDWTLRSFDLIFWPPPYFHHSWTKFSLITSYTDFCILIKLCTVRLLPTTQSSLRYLLISRYRFLSPGV